MPRPRTTAWTGIVAAVLAILGAVGHLGEVLHAGANAFVGSFGSGMWSDFADIDEQYDETQHDKAADLAYSDALHRLSLEARPFIAIGALLAVMLLAGAIGLLLRRNWGRYLVSASALIALATNIWYIQVNIHIWDAANGYSRSLGYDEDPFPMVYTVLAVMLVVFPVIVAVLALLPTTGAWCRARIRK